MRRFERPAMPCDFPQAVAAARDAVMKAVTSGETPVFVDCWGEFKSDFNLAQAGRCGFCEGPVGGMAYGDVEHFRPKGAVHELHDDPAFWGCEIPGSGSVEGRVFKSPARAPGYWWLAYEWDNYLLSCALCNQRWKGNLFPVEGARAQAPGEAAETTLLLSPFDLSDPAKHFRYGRMGEITGISRQGRNTIATCGLDRPSLRLLRFKLASRTHAALDTIAGGSGDAMMLEKLRQIRADGAATEAFSGMVQTIFQQRSGRDWAAMGKLIEALERGAARRTAGAGT